jgi:glycosyltransferase involved in cell wall biosynthesis
VFELLITLIGGLPEIFEDDVTVLLFEQGNADEFAAKMKLLWKNPDMYRRMGIAGRRRAIREYSEQIYYER